MDFPPIFISYGHDDHSQFVFRIQEELEKLGYKVWIDKEGIVPGKDWRQKIYEGIEQSRRFLAFISQHSVDSEVQMSHDTLERA